jgi:phosphatidate cytidylyltransferase
MPPARRSRQSASRSRSQGGGTREPARRSRSGGREPREPREPRQRRQRSDVWQRVLVAIPAAFVAIVFIDLGGLAFALFLIAIGLVCMHELYRLLDRWKPLPVVGFASLLGMVLAARFGGLRYVMEVAVATVPVLFLFVIGRGQRRGATVTIAGTLLGVYWIGFAFAHAELLQRLPHGTGVLVDVLVGTFLGDTAAYLGGRAFGRRPLAPEISPSKTVEGLFCGMFIAILTVFLAGLYQDWLTQGDALLLGIAVAVFGPIGDLFESLIKRDAGAKDAGKLFGAHGGALDRLDAALFTIVAGYYVWLAAIH